MSRSTWPFSSPRGTRRSSSGSTPSRPTGRTSATSPRGGSSRYQVAVLIVMRVYERWWKYTSLRDVLSLARALVVAEIAAYASMWLLPPIDRGGERPAAARRGGPEPGAGRAAAGRRRARWRGSCSSGRGPFVRGREVLVVGAGDAGELVVREMLKKRSGYTPIGLVDDDPRSRTCGCTASKVLGTTADLAGSCASRGPTRWSSRCRPRPARAPAASSTPAARTASRSARCRAGGAARRRLDLVAPAARGAGRGPARPRARRSSTSTGSARYVRGRVVLVTGAGGSIGSELVPPDRAAPPAARWCWSTTPRTNLFEIDRELAERGVTGIDARASATSRTPQRMRARARAPPAATSCSTPPPTSTCR